MDTSTACTIAPKAFFLQNMDIDAMLSEDIPLVTVRRSKYPFEEIEDIDGSKHLSEDCVDEDVFNYSMNLLGGMFEPSLHLNIRPIGDGWQKWDGKTILSEQKVKELSAEEYGYPIYYKVEDFHNKTFPYKKTVVKEKAYETEKDRLVKLGLSTAIGIWNKDNPEVDFMGKTLVNHEPSMLNYWHVTLDVYEPGTTVPIRKCKSAWQKQIRGYISRRLCDYYIPPSHVADYSISEKFYIV